MADKCGLITEPLGTPNIEYLNSMFLETAFERVQAEQGALSQP